MSQYITSEEYARSVRLRVVETAQAMLDGQLSFLIGSRRLAALRHETGGCTDDADFLVFVAIDSETDEFPLGSVREHWAADALARLEPEIHKAEAWAFMVGENACRALIARFAQQDRISATSKA